MALCLQLSVEQLKILFKGFHDYNRIDKINNSRKNYQQNKKKQKELISCPLIEQLKILNYLNTAVCIVISYNFLTMRKDSNI